MKRLAPLIAVAALLIQPKPLAADASDGLSGAEITELVTNALQKVGLSGDPGISKYRHFPACSGTPTVEPKTDSWRTITLRCNSGDVWERSLRLPSMKLAALTRNTDAPEGPQQTVVTLSQSLPRGTVLRQKHLVLSETAVAAGDQFFTDAELVLGRTLQVNLGQGRAIKPRHLKIAWVVEKGTPVAITSSIPGVAVEMAGLALEAGQFGDIIDVRNTGSGRVIKAIVEDRNKVRVRPNMN